MLVAAPALITIAVVGVALYSQPEEKPAGTARPREPLPADGWYVANPMVSARAEMDDCLSILPDDAYDPGLGQDRCAPEDPLQRLKLETLGAGGLLIKAFNAWDKIWCATLAARENGARVVLRPCRFGDPLQRFALEATGTTPRRQTVYRLQPASTRENGMCVGIAADHPATVHTVHTNCGHAGVLGYVFTPAATPTGSS